MVEEGGDYWKNEAVQQLEVPFLDGDDDLDLPEEPLRVDFRSDDRFLDRTFSRESCLNEDGSSRCLTMPNRSSQVALVGSKLCPIESLDYEIIENDISFKIEQDWKGKGKRQIFQYVVLKWTMCFLLGLIVGAIGFFNNLAVENIAGVKFVVTSNLMLSRQYGWAFAVFAASNFILVMTSSLITCLFAPAAAGSGIPEVKAYLNGIDAPKILSFRTLIIKVYSPVSATKFDIFVWF